MLVPSHPKRDAFRADLRPGNALTLMEGLSDLTAPRPARLPNPKPTTINKLDAHYERGTTGRQVTTYGESMLRLIKERLGNVMQRTSMGCTQPMGRKR